MLTTINKWFNMVFVVNKMYIQNGGEKLDSEKIGARLRELRGDRSQKEIADAIGVTDMAISLYENGERIPRDEIKRAIAKYFGVTVESIFYAD
jgi:DNA-binding XRE family transcriptional regulator